MTLAMVAPGIRGWLYAMLSADSTLNTAVGGRIYDTQVPSESETYPVVVYQEQSPGNDIWGQSAARIWVQPIYLVKVIGETRKFSDIKAAADRIVTVLHHTSGGHNDIRVDYCVMVREFSMAETDESTKKHYRHLGGEFRIGAMTA